VMMMMMMMPIMPSDFRI
jgi:hypothetical protein